MRSSALQPGYRPGFRVGGPGLADLQRAAARRGSGSGGSAEPLPSEEYLRARAALREQATSCSRGGAAFAPSDGEVSDGEANDAGTRVVTVGRISASFTLPPERDKPKEPEIGVALPPALKKQRKKEERKRREGDGAAGPARVLQQQAQALQRQAEAEATGEGAGVSLESRALAGEFAEGNGDRLGRGLWERPEAEYHAAPVRIAASGVALGRIVEQVQTHNRLLQVDDMWRRHGEGGAPAAAAAAAREADGRPRPKAADRSAEIQAAREEAAQRKLAVRAAGETAAAAAAAALGGAVGEDGDKKRKEKKHKKHKKEKREKKERKEKKEKRERSRKKRRREDVLDDGGSSSSET